MLAQNPPTAHDSHAVELTWELNVPAEHGVQLVLPVLAEYCPGRHGRHAAPVASAYLPLSQATQRSAVHVVAFDALRSESKL